MTAWRVIITDSESMSGVAPVCPRQTEPNGPHDLEGPDEDDETARFHTSAVYDCCPGPYLDCHRETWADVLVRKLTAADVDVCE